MIEKDKLILFKSYASFEKNNFHLLTKKEANKPIKTLEILINLLFKS